MLSQFAYRRAASVKDAVAAAGHPNARILAGGTDLLGCLRDRVMEAGSLVSISHIAELKGIASRPGGGVKIGALTTLTEIAENRQIVDSYRVLAQAAASVGSPQLRNQGTIGGNICQRPRCSYFRGDFACRRKGGDTCYAASGDNRLHCIFGGSGCYMVHPSDTAAALVALDARLTITGRRGVRTVAAESFFILPEVNIKKENVLEPGDVVTEILLDKPAAGTRSLYRKVRERGAFDFALAGAAISLTPAGGKAGSARIVLSGVAPAPWRAKEAEQAIAGKPLDAPTIAAAVSAAVKDATALPENEYKILLVKGILRESLTALAA
ncbi:MAG: xanthine dehydrogenase family protein subunit M [Bryobacterales bacterium]|nr:xanthine dehydrogenase family protein subunit M [Bryobacterales bacterium]